MLFRKAIKTDCCKKKKKKKHRKCISTNIELFVQYTGANIMSSRVQKNEAGYVQYFAQVRKGTRDVHPYYFVTKH
jgi:hypothetical protein